MALIQQASDGQKRVFFAIVAVIALTALYLRFFTSTPSSASLAFWPAVGLLVALLLGVSPRQWWLVIVFFAGVDLVLFASDSERYGEFGSWLFSSVSLYGLLTIACGFMWRRYKDGAHLYRLTPDLRDFLIFAFATSVAFALLEAAISILGGDSVELRQMQKTTVSVFTSILVVAPCALSWLAPPQDARRLTHRTSLIEIGILLLGMITVIAYGLARGSAEVRSLYDLPQLVLPFVLWAAFRFDFRVTSITLLIAATYVTVQLANGIGPFYRMSADPLLRALAAGWFLAGNGVAALILSSYVATTRRQSSESKRAEAFLNQFVRAIDASFYEFDPKDNRFVYIEGALTRLNEDYRRMMSDADSFPEMVHPEDRDRVLVFWKNIGHGRQRELVDISYRFHPRPEVLSWVRSLVVPGFDKDGELIRYFGITYDITDHEKLRVEQARLRDIVLESDKLHSLGALGAGLAHNWNNLLFVLSAETDELELRVDDDPEMRESISTFRRVIDQGTDITGQMLALARRDFGPFKQVRLHEEVSRAVKLLQRSMPANITVHAPLPAAVDFDVRVKASYLHQIVLNLGLNARNAIGYATGSIDFDIEGPFVGAAQGSDEKFATLIVEDNGCGMTDDVRKRIFEPLFSTRAEKGGTGLGLSVVMTLVREMSGKIDVESTPQVGSKFTISLPVVATVTSGEDPD